MTRDHYYIYTRDKHGKLTGHTICVMMIDGKIFHGTAVCSEDDHFEYKKGRETSLARCQAAYQRYLERCEAKKAKT